MKSIKEDDIEGFIRTNAQEHLMLEYKAAGALTKTDHHKFEISKDVSAMANSQGGLIVYGIRENNHLPESIDPIDPAAATKEWLEQIINSKIQKRIPSLIIHSISLTGANEGRFVYVVEVPESLDAPHQASDHRYYKRFNFEVRPMEDYEVRDVANRKRSPIIEAKILFVGTIYQSRNETLSAQLQITLENTGKVLAEKIYLEIELPEGIINSYSKFHFEFESFFPTTLQYRRYKYFFQNEMGAVPIFPGTNRCIFDGNKAYLMLNIPKAFYSSNLEEFVRCSVFADGAPPNINKKSIRELVPLTSLS